MTSTPLDQAEAAPDVRDLDASAVLEAVVSARRTADVQEARLLALAVHWVDLHPVTPDHPAATFPTQRADGLAGALGPSFFDRAPLAGVGTPAVAEYAVEELAAALNLSHAAGLALVSEAVELCYRLPRLWALVQDGSLQAWKARQVARATTQLSAAAVAFVDRHLAATARSNRIPGPEPGAARGPAALRPGPGGRGRAERPGAPRGLAGPPRVHRHHPGHRPPRHPGRPRPGRHRQRPRGPAGPARRPPGPGRPARLRARDARAPATGARPGRRHRHRHRVRRRGEAGRSERVPRHALPARLAGGPRDRQRRWPGREARRRLADAAAGLAAADGRGHRPAGARPDSDRGGGRARPARLDAGGRDPAGRALRVPRLPRRCPGLRPRPPRDLRPARPGWAARPDQPGEPGLPVPTAPPDQDFRRLALPAAPRSRDRWPNTRHDVRVDQPARPHLPRHRPLTVDPSTARSDQSCA